MLIPTPQQGKPAGSALKRLARRVLLAVLRDVAAAPVFSYTRAYLQAPARDTGHQTRQARTSHLRRLVLPAALLLVLAAGFSFLAKPAPALAATTSTVNFQARLMAGNGAIAPDGSYNVEFKLYNASSGGTALWTETRNYNGGTPDNRVTVANGYLTVNLGSVNPFPSNLNWGQQLYLTMNIGGTGTPSWDGEMNPRLLLTAVPAAYSLTQYNSTTGFGSSLTLQAPTGGDQTFVVQDQGAAGTYSLGVYNPSTSNGFVQLQTATPGTQQSGNVNVSGTVMASVLQAATLDSASAGVLGIGTTNATGITLGKSGVDTTVAGRLGVGRNPTANLDVYATNPAIGDVLFSVGSNQQNGQFVVKDRTAITIGTVGMQINQLTVSEGANNQRIGTVQNAGNYIELYPDMTLATGGTNNILLKPGGNVGIGTSGAPGALLSVGGSTGNFTVDSSGKVSTSGAYALSGSQVLDRSGTTLTVGSHPYWQALNLDTNGVTRLSIDSSGNTTIGANLTTSALGLDGIANPQGALQIANGSWLTATDAAGTGVVNMFSVNSDNEIQAGAAINVDGGIVLPTNAGQVTLVDLPIDSTATAGTAESYSLRVGTSNVLTVYGEADGSGNLQNGRVAVGSSIAPQYTLDVTGDINTSANIRTGGVVRLDNGGNLSSIGTINSGGITSTGTLQIGAIAGFTSGTGAPLRIDANGSLGVLRITSTGVHILGNTNPSYPLDVQGDINLTGDLRINGTVVCTGTSCTGSGGGGSGVTTVGALDGGTANANGATISSTTMYLQSASASFAGLVNTGTQTFAGAKTFNDNLTVGGAGTLYVTAGGADITGNATFENALNVVGASFLNGGATITGTVAASSIASLIQIGSAISGGNASGTYIGLNAPSTGAGSAADFLNFQKNGISNFKVDNTGTLSAGQGDFVNGVTAAGISAALGYSINGTSGSSVTCTGGQVLQNQVVQGGITTGGTCATVGGGSGDNITVNGTAAADANFLNTTATGTVAGTTWTLNTGATPNTIALSVGAASTSVAGVITTGTQSFAGAKSFTGKLTVSASTTGLAVTGAPVAGTGITSLLQLGSAIVGGNNATSGGTYIGLNAPSTGNGSAADFLNLQKNGASMLKLDNAGNLTVGNINNGGSQLTVYGSILAGNNAFNVSDLGEVSIGWYGSNALAVGGTPGVNAADSLIQVGNHIQGGNAVANGGTYIGLNAPSTGAGSAADFLNFQKNGTSEFQLDNSGNLTTAGTADIGGVLSVGQTVSGHISIPNYYTLSASNGLTVNAGYRLTLNGGTSGSDVTIVGATHQVGIGNTSPGYELDVGGDINTSTQYRVAGTAGSTTTCSGGQVLQDQVVQGGIVTGGTCATAGGSGSGVTTVGALDGGTYSANGASISGTTIYLQAATGTHVGLVTTGAQTFAGAKTFNDNVSFNGQIISNGYTGATLTCSPNEVATGLTYENGLYVGDDNTGCHALGGSGSGVTTVGALDGGTYSANGASISGTTVYLQAATSSHVGLLTTGVQNIGGSKTFGSSLTANSGLTVNGGSSLNGGLNTDTLYADSTVSFVGAPTASATASLIQVGNAIQGGNAVTSGGTYIGLNAPSTFAGDLLNLQYDGTSVLTANSSRVEVHNELTVDDVAWLNGEANFYGDTWFFQNPVVNAAQAVVNIGNAISGGNTTVNGGTYLGLNAPSTGAGSAADFLNFQKNGTSKLKLDNAGNLTVAGSMTAASGGFSSSFGAGANGTILQVNGTGVTIGGAVVPLIVNGQINATSGYQFNGTSGSTVTCSGGQVLQNQVVQGGIVTGGTCATVGGSGSGVTTVGALDGGTANANGATISGTTLYLQSASATMPGLVNTGTQTFAGNKTFNGSLTTFGGEVDATDLWISQGLFSADSVNNSVVAGGTFVALSNALVQGYIDSYSDSTLNIGTSGGAATTIALNQNTTIASGKTLTVNGSQTITNANASTVALVVQGAVSQTAELLQVTNGSGAIADGLHVMSDGTVKLSNGNSSNPELTVDTYTYGGSGDAIRALGFHKGISASGTSDISGLFQSYNASNTLPTLVTKQVGASTADLFQVQNSSGNSLFSIGSAGKLTVSGTPTASATSSLIQIGNAISGGNAVANGGTYLGLNAPSTGAGSSADLMNLQVGGTTEFLVQGNGGLEVAHGKFYVDPNQNLVAVGDGNDLLVNDNMYIDGTITTNSVATMNIGGGLATTINLNSNTTLASGKTLTVTSGAVNIQGAPVANANSSLIRIGNAIAGGNAGTNGGTYIGLNAPSTGAGSAADLINLQTGGTSRFKITSNGSIVAVDSAGLNLLNETDFGEFRISDSFLHTIISGNQIDLSPSNGDGVWLQAPSAPNALQVVDGTSKQVFNVDTSGYKVTLGSITATAGRAVQGKLLFADGTTDNFGLTLQSNTLTANRTYSFPNSTAATDTVCLQTLANCGGGGSGVTTVGALDGGTYSANGASISGSSIYLQAATASHVGLVTTGTQEFAGTKLFDNDTQFAGTIYVEGSLGSTISGSLDLGSVNATDYALRIQGTPPANGGEAAVNFSNNLITGGNANGTYLGLNSPSTGAGSAADFLNFQKNNVVKLKLDNSGNLTVGGAINSNSFTSSQLTFGAASAATIQSANNQNLIIQSQGVAQLSLNSNGAVSIGSPDIELGSGGSNSTINVNGVLESLGGINGTSLLINRTTSASATASLIQIGSAIQGGNAATNGGTYLGLNAPSTGAGSAADFLNFQKNGSSKLKVANDGSIYVNGLSLQLKSDGEVIAGSGISAYEFYSTYGYEGDGGTGVTTTCSGGQVMQNQVVWGGIVTGGTCATVGGGSGVTTVGALDGGTANANGATISGSTLYLQSASGSNAGLVNTGTQTFAGAKTFSNNVTIGSAGTLYVQGGMEVTGGNATFDNSINVIGSSYLNNGAIITGTVSASATASLVRIGSAIQGGNAVTNGGTYIGLNAPSTGAGSAADFLNFQKNGVSKLKVDNSGNLTVAGTMTAAAGAFSVDSNGWLTTPYAYFGGTGGTAIGTTVVTKQIQAGYDVGTSGIFQSTSTTNIYPTLISRQEGTATADLFQVQDSAFNPLLAINYQGKLGVGDTSFAYELGVSDSQASNYVARIQNTSTANTADGLLIDLGVANASRGTGNYFVGFSGGGTVAGKIQGGASAVAYTTSGADYAEYFRADPGNLPQPGELVMLDGQGDQTVKATGTSGDFIAGVVSTNPGFVGNGPICKVDDQDCDSDYAKYNVLVSMVGQVPVKVSMAGGSIRPGDPIGASDVAGVGQKVTNPGTPIIGYAIASADSDGTVMVLVRPGYYNLTGAGDIQGTNVAAQNLNISGLATISNLTVTGKADIATLTVKDVVVTMSLTVNGHIISGNSSGTTTAVAGADAGTGATVVMTGNDTAGTITVTTGAQTTGTDAQGRTATLGDNPAAGALATITFAKAYGAVPTVVLTPASASGASLGYYYNAGSGSFTLSAANLPAANTTYTFSYHVIQ